jgi:hypothetical protein
MTSLSDLIKEITNENLNLNTLHFKLQPLIASVPASVKYHHNWTGGYQDHVRQVIEHALAMYDRFFSEEMSCPTCGKGKLIQRDCGFNRDDVILVAYIHDLDKLFRYKKLDKPKDGREWDYARAPSYDESAKVAVMCAQSGILLEDKHLEALAMHHGGWSANPNRDMSPLAVIIHSADLMSTYITNRKGD